jgi:hypothetical protein
MPYVAPAGRKRPERVNVARRGHCAKRDLTGWPTPHAPWQYGVADVLESFHRLRDWLARPQTAW